MAKTAKDFLTKKVADLKQQNETITKSLIECDNLEERAAMGETLKAIAEELAEVEETLGTIDEPAEEQPTDGEAGERAAAIIATHSTKQDTASAEQRAQALVQTGRATIEGAECRAVLMDSGVIATPTEVGGINNPFNTVSSVIDAVKVENCTGMGRYEIAYVDSWQTAAKKNSGAAANASDPVFKKVAIAPFTLAVVSYIDAEIRKQTPLQYEAKVREGALIALRKKAAEWAITGDGAAAAHGIYNAANTAKESMVEKVTISAIDEKTLRNIVFAYGGDENVGGGAELWLNKADLVAFGDVRGTNEKGAVYEIIPDGSNPNMGTIKDGGLSVRYRICSSCNSFANGTGTSAGLNTMIYGQPSNYTLGVFGDYEIKVSEDAKFEENMLAIRGVVSVGGNVTSKNGFVVVTKKTTAAS